MVNFWITAASGGPSPSPSPSPSSSPDRSFLAPIQRRAVTWLVPRLPVALSPSDLTRLGLLGALVVASALILCRWWADVVYLVPVGVLLNWFGAAVDGPLADHRREQHKRRGLVEHLTDLASLFIMIVAYAFSPFLTFEAAAIILTCYLLFSAYTYIRAATGHVEQMALIGVGAAEFRLMLAFWPFVARALDAAGGVMVTFATAILAGIAVVALMLKVYIDARKIASRVN